MTIQYATTGTGQGDADGSSEANRIELKKVLENDAGLLVALAAGDTIYCKDDGVLAWTDGSDFCTLAIGGSVTAPIKVIGYTTSIGDGGAITIQNSAGQSGTSVCFNHGSTREYYQYFNIIVDGGSDAWRCVSDGMLWVNCHAKDMGADGWDWNGSSTGHCPVWVGCSAVNCNGNGFDTGARNPIWINCIAIDCGDTTSEYGFRNSTATSSQVSVLVNCFASQGAGSGYYMADQAVFVNCGSNRNSNDGFQFASDTVPMVMVNCFASANGADGLEGATANSEVIAIHCDFNPTGETNTTGEVGSNVTVFDYSNTSDSPSLGNPLFTQSNPGTPANVDLGIAINSPWIDAGFPMGGGANPTQTNSYMDVGVAQRAYVDTPAICPVIHA